MIEIAKRYQIDFGLHLDGDYVANVFCIVDNQVAQLHNPSLRKLLAQISTVVRKKETLLKRFPLPADNPIVTLPPQARQQQETSRIILPNGS